MNRRLALLAFASGTLGLAALAPAAAQSKGNAPKWEYAHDLRVRPGGAKDINEKTPRIGVEVFHDDTNKAAVAISETGSIAVTPLTDVGADKKADWLTAHDMRVRRAGEPEFTQGTKQFGVEVFKDPGSKSLLYASETGSIAFAPVPASGLTSDKGPKWHHALEPKVRGPEEETFEKAKKYGVEVFKDENTGGLVYITETGAIATAPENGPAPDPKKVLPPKPVYGLVLRVRGADEPNFSDKTKKVGVEVFDDPNDNVLFYLSGTGSIATAPKPASLGETGGVKWVGAMNLKARKGGEKDFAKAKKYGVEVFKDNKTGYLVYVSDTGSIAVLPTK